MAAKSTQPSITTWTINYCHKDEAKYVDRIPTMRKQLEMTGDVPVGVICAVERQLVSQDNTILKSTAIRK
jgi:hypothetical protein